MSFNLEPERILIEIGKSILSAYIVQQMQEQSSLSTVYHICNSYTTGKDLQGEILRSVAA